MSEILEIDRAGRVLRLVLNRPEKRNALSFALCRELVLALDEAVHDRGIGAILMCANGPAFCAGMDLNEALSPEAAAQSHIHEQLFTVGSRITKPIVAAVQGPALAGGLGLVANAHIVLAAVNATFGLTEIRIGLWPFMVFRAVALALGERRAVELSLTGRTFGTPEAYHSGLVQHVTRAEELRVNAESVADALASSSAEAIRSGLRFVHESRGRSWTEAGRLARRFRQDVFESSDFQEGVLAFREKRKPQWPSIQ